MVAKLKLEEKMKKIGLVLSFKGTNYGLLLQGYATQQYLQRHGYETEIICLGSKRNGNIMLSLESAAYFGIRKIGSTFRNELKECTDDLHQENEKQRKLRGDEFRDTMLQNIRKFNTVKDLTKWAEENYCAVLVGSDQMWLPHVGFTRLNTLRFAPKSVTRISYATSLGVSEYPWYVRRLAADFFNKIDYLSVREEQGRQIIKEVSDCDAQVVLDPTFLLSKEEWQSLIPHEQVVAPDYVLCYLLGDNMPMGLLAQKYAQKRGLRVVSILSNEVCSDVSKFSDEILIGKSPMDFVNLIRNAECVFTDSFHGCAFSINHQKQVFVSYRVRKGLASRNSRIDNILRIFGLQDRLIQDFETAAVDDVIDYELVQHHLLENRAESEEFLHRALQNI